MRPNASMGVKGLTGFVPFRNVPIAKYHHRSTVLRFKIQCTTGGLMIKSFLTTTTVNAAS